MITHDILVLLNLIASVSEKAGQLVKQIYESWAYHKGFKSQILYNLHGACNICVTAKSMVCPAQSCFAVIMNFARTRLPVLRQDQACQRMRMIN